MYLWSTKKNNLKKLCNPPPPPRQGVNSAPYVPKLYASSGKDISKCIEDGSMKLATQVDYMYHTCMYNVSHRHFRVINVFFYYFFYYYLVKAKPL